MNSSAIDSVSLWLTESLLPKSVGEADRLVIAQMKTEATQKPLDDLLDDIQEKRREEPGQFGLEFAAALIFPWLVPAVHNFVKSFAKKFVEGAASESGKMTATALQSRISHAFSKEAEPGLRRDAAEELERCLIERAHAMNLPKSSYEDILHEIRSNSHLAL